ncbi:MAG: Lon-insertion domain-containing protein [Oscillospiraceae bacterium]
MDRTFENEVEYAKLIGSLSKKKKIRSLNKQAVAKVIEYSSRLAEDSENSALSRPSAICPGGRFLGPQIKSQSDRQKITLSRLFPNKFTAVTALSRPCWNRLTKELF